MRKPLIVGNWKMYGRRADLPELQALQERIGAATTRADIVICPPCPLIHNAVWVARETSISIGAQDCSALAEDAARTGDVSASMLADVGAKYVIVGHSERRTNHAESNETIRQKAEAAIASGLTPIICVGETKTERDAGQVAAVVGRQVAESTPQKGGFVIAYEPVWAIGGASTPTVNEIRDVHAVVRDTLRGRATDEPRVLYGGSVNASNAAEIFAVEGVDGALVGRASLKATDFAAIILAHPAAS